MSNNSIKFLCHQCLVDGHDECLFPPSICLTHGHLSNKSCVACRSSGRPCNFLNVDDNSCIRCRRNGIPCRIQLSGESRCMFFPAPLFPPSYLVYFHSARVRPHNVLNKSLEYFSPASTINSLPPLLVPNWIHVYYPTSTSTSRRTQAAAIAHLFLEELSGDSINTVSHRVDSNPSSIRQITVPKRIISKLPSPVDVRDTIYVCDGGLDYSLPAAHPHSVSRVIFC